MKICFISGRYLKLKGSEKVKKANAIKFLNQAIFLLLHMYQVLLASRLSTTPTRSLILYAIFYQTVPS